MTGNLKTLYPVLGAVLLLWIFVGLTSHRRRRPLPPGPKPAPLIGNLLQMPKSYLWRYFHSMSKQYGPIMHFNVAGQSIVILSTYEAAHELLNRRSSKFSDRPRMVMAGELVCKGMHILFRPYNERYRLHQRMESPVVNPRASATYRPLQDIESRQTLFDIMRDIDAQGEKGVNFHHHYQRAMASTIYYLIYGYRLKTGREKELVDAQAVEAAVTLTGQVGAYLVDSFPWLNILPTFLAPWKKEAEALWEVECQLHLGNLNRGIASRGWNFCKQMKSSSAAKDMSDIEFAFDAGVMADAGLDTTVIALSWFVVAWLANNNGWVTKAQQLLDDVVGRDRLPTFEDRPRLAFIDAIANEVLRWRPVALGGIPHFTKTEDEYMDYRIPANSIVIANSFSVVQEEAVFGEKADQFNPERWLVDKNGLNQKDPVIDVNGQNTSELKDLPQIGFGYGRRICVGRFIARNSLFIQIARNLWAFEVDSAVEDGTGKRFQVDDMTCRDGFLCPPNHFRAIMRPRGQWVRDIVAKSGYTHDLDHCEILEQAHRS